MLMMVPEKRWAVEAVLVHTSFRFDNLAESSSGKKNLHAASCTGRSGRSDSMPHWQVALLLQCPGAGFAKMHVITLLTCNELYKKCMGLPITYHPHPALCNIGRLQALVFSRIASNSWSDIERNQLTAHNTHASDIESIDFR